ncbi:hypothetical protein A3H38_01515 [candidate division WOR-1 bacterium RIFCSPLOWO2_02_FULL_46_20]|uniref:DUF3467 domain-containing protein n=2 Tax=Saganbacteria TaxID=1703751 RepID=A0A1F4RDG5_UNCSA|nr:MAG: hypothetical protein A3J44_06835 [candidate division WOR-1 bacterium RIFCSPHIGHO2_02_FULL_45_12]OGC06219.1 MAG: hypothetical protein A3H38_01515 [candidate division WOR-1 bacterium RIFCSPLOWO2_02_FULL_46_20]OGC10023.1 MAG: hypothetical protein A3F86_03860 [candidate division WOR-1 bacterium RIFCSPLOWO2_12_FULL_45_9]
MEEQKIPIDVPERIAAGVYSNVAVISHNESEFILDFIFAHPPKGRVNARVVMSPSHAKRFLQALQENIGMYEKKSGTIKKAPEPPKFGIDLSKN